jgi:(p)ppGpp synthase/HD superfamily hydrolase
MPLHAVTLELDRLPAADNRTVAGAAEWAAEVHAGQRRTRAPYLNHLLRVTLRILRYYRITDVDVLVAALLHDAVEDQPWAVTGRPTGHGPPP